MNKNILSKMEIIQGDITKLDVGAIVNAANVSLCGGGGVDGAIHRAAGKELLAHCRTLGGCETGSAKITKGFNLPAKYIIHTVGPVWDGGRKNEEALLASCYRECLRIADENDVSSIAFPAISCGAYRFPIDLACEIAVNEIVAYLDDKNVDLKVLLVCFDEKLRKVFGKVFSAISNDFA